MLARTYMCSKRGGGLARSGRVRTPDLTHDRTVLSRFGQRGQLLESHQKFCVHDHLSLKYCSEVAVPTTIAVHYLNYFLKLLHYSRF